MPKQYNLTNSPSKHGYRELEKQPVILAAQLSLDLANLVGSNYVDPENPILRSTTHEIKSAIEKSFEIGPFLDGKESDFLSVAESYIDAILNKNNSEMLYTQFITTLSRATPIEEIKA
nr:hypothetical protein [uncultured Desulfobacter sp.]